MRAYTQEMQAKVVEAQAEVPKAMADALRSGRLGVMDYYSMKNIAADTDMGDRDTSFYLSMDEGTEKFRSFH